MFQLSARLEVVFGTLKICLLIAVGFAMIFFQYDASPESAICTSKYPNAAVIRDLKPADSTAQALLMRISVAAFAFMGLEIIACDPSNRNSTYSRGTQQRSDHSKAKYPFWNTTSLIGLGAPVYMLVGILYACYRQNDVILSSMSWWTISEVEGFRLAPAIFMLETEASSSPRFTGWLSVPLVLLALTSANTVLYTASRSLFNLTVILNDQYGNPSCVRYLDYLRRTNQRRVPLRAVVASCIAAGLMLYLANDHVEVKIDTLLNILAKFISTGIIIVWACVCWAFIRLYRL